jgi:hypothetical protein
MRERRYSSVILDLGILVSFTHRPLHEEGAPGTHSTQGWVGPKAGLEAVEKKKTLIPAGKRSMAVQPAAHGHKSIAHSVENGQG